MPVRESRDQHSFDNFPELFAVFHALQSLLTPRHPPCALSSLTTFIQRSAPTSPRSLRPFLRTAFRRQTHRLHHAKFWLSLLSIRPIVIAGKAQNADTTIEQ